ncbi:unnamed protein product [Cuscuta epithymum]|uniref:Uncharacterized protein n=1 Tax=Cuscuta epithymum TaxID=186058 RepID=A0AAV0G5Y1_9ASTE|nr:unnamed protein product [Cuscuta epithymum]
MGVGSLAPEFLSTGSLNPRKCVSSDQDIIDKLVKTVENCQAEVKQLREQIKVQGNNMWPSPMNPYPWYGGGQPSSGIPQQMPCMFFQQGQPTLSQQSQSTFPNPFTGVPQASLSQPPPYYPIQFANHVMSGQPSTQPATVPFVPLQNTTNSQEDNNAFIDNLLASG